MPLVVLSPSICTNSCPCYCIIDRILRLGHGARCEIEVTKKRFSRDIKPSGSWLQIILYGVSNAIILPLHKSKLMMWIPIVSVGCKIQRCEMDGWIHESHRFLAWFQRTCTVSNKRPCYRPTEPNFYSASELAKAWCRMTNIWSQRLDVKFWARCCNLLWPLFQWSGLELGW